MSDEPVMRLPPISPDAAMAWLKEAARYFEGRATGGEDAAYWSNFTNAENCKRIRDLIATLSPTEGQRR